jgi:hypothetical protein
MDHLERLRLTKAEAYWFLYRFMEVVAQERDDQKWSAELMKKTAIEQYNLHTKSNPSPQPDIRQTIYESLPSRSKK